MTDTPQITDATDTEAASNAGNNWSCECGGPMAVIDSRVVAHGVRRRRVCRRCGNRETTYEISRRQIITMQRWIEQGAEMCSWITSVKIDRPPRKDRKHLPSSVMPALKEAP